MAKAVLADAPTRFALAGFLLGGIVALEMVAEAPERIGRLALIATTARADPAARAEREGKGAREIEQEFLRHIALGERTEPKEAAAAAFFLALLAGARITGELISVSGYMVRGSRWLSSRSSKL